MDNEHDVYCTNEKITHMDKSQVHTVNGVSSHHNRYRYNVRMLVKRYIYTYIMHPS